MSPKDPTGNVPNKFEGSWTVPAGIRTVNFTVPANETYYMWLECNITGGILAWNATATVTNNNVPVVGSQYAWVFTGNPNVVDFTSIPNQFVGTPGTILRSSTIAGPTNTFNFGILNGSGGTITVRYGWVVLS